MPRALGGAVAGSIPNRADPRDGRAGALYNVHVKRYTVAQARRQLAEVLNAAERGDSVVIERRGVRFVVETRQRRRRPPVRRKSVIQRLDPSVAAGEWTWSWTAGGLRFKGRPRVR